MRMLIGHSWVHYLTVVITSLAVFLTCSTLVSSVAISRTHHDGLRKSISAEMLYSKVKRTRTNGGGFKRPPPNVAIRNSPPATLTVNYEESVKLECEAGGTPPPFIHWLKDGQRITPEIQQDDQIELDSDDNVLNPLSGSKKDVLGLTLSRSRVILDCASANDAGRYTCVAENPYKRVSSDTQLNIVPHDHSGDHSRNNCPNEGGKVSARIQMWTHTRLELIGNDVTLQCRAVGYPEPEITWIGPNDTPLANDLRFQILSSGDLLIYNISWKDMGSYTCLAENTLGLDTVSTFLYPALNDR